MSYIKENLSNIFKSDNETKKKKKIILSGKIKQDDFRLKIKLSHYDIVEISSDNGYYDYKKILPDESFNNNRLKIVRITNYEYSKCILPSIIKKINLVKNIVCSKKKNLMDLSSTFAESIYTYYHIELFPKTMKNYILDLQNDEKNPNILYNLPKFLESLYIKNNFSNINLNNLPTGLINFCYLSSKTIPNIDNLPTNLINVYFCGDDVEGDFSNLPSSIKDLVIELKNYNNKIKKSLDNLPNQIEKLDAKFNHTEQKTELFVQNQNIKILHLDFGENINDNEFINKIPKNIEELYLYNYIGKNIIFNDILQFKNLKLLRLPESLDKTIKFEDITKTTLKKIFVPANINIIFFNDTQKETFVNNDKVTIDNLEIIKYNISHDYLMDQLEFVGGKIRLNFNYPVKELIWQ